MTTIVWDGKTLSADTRITYLDEGGKLVARTDDMIRKILRSNKFRLRGEEVQAIAISGMMTVIDLMVLAIMSPQIGEIDFSEEVFFKEGGGLYGRGDFTVTLITPTKSAYITMVNNEFTLVEQSRNEIIVAGSCTSHSVAYALRGFSSDRVVGMCMLLDKFTGGSIQTWDSETQELTEKPFDGFLANYKNIIKAVFIPLKGKKK